MWLYLIDKIINFQQEDIEKKEVTTLLLISTDKS